MIRLLIFILMVIFVVSTATVLADMDSALTAIVLGKKINMPLGLFIGVLVFAAGLLIVGTSVANYFAGMPERMRMRKRQTTMDRGVAALTRGLEAVAVGDPDDAQHHARIARRHLGEGSVTRLLTAQAAELAGDDDAAGQSYSAMLEAPETEFLGLRGLYDKATRAGDAEAARGFAERAFRLRSNAGWAFQSVFDLALDRGAWGEARDALATALKNKVVDAVRARRGEAALLAAAAYAAEQAGDNATALDEAEHALKAAPGFAPAAALAARIHLNGNREHRALKALEHAFAASPDKALIAAYLNLFADKDDATKAQRLRAMADRHSDAPAAMFARAQAHLLVGEKKEAIAAMEPLLAESAPSQDCSFMARAVGAAFGEAAARPWLERAARAQRNPDPGADGVYTLTRAGWAILIREFMEHNRLYAPPLEGQPLGLPAEEIKLLAAPLAAIAAPKDEEPETAGDVEAVAPSDDSALESVNIGDSKDSGPETAPEPDDAPKEDAFADARPPKADGPPAPEGGPEQSPDSQDSPDSADSDETSDAPAGDATSDAEEQSEETPAPGAAAG